MGADLLAALRPFAPLGLSAAAAAATLRWRRSISPATATWLLTAASASAFLVSLWALASLAVTALGHPGWPPLWCRPIPAERSGVPASLGALAGIVMLASVGSVVRSGYRELRAVRALPEGPGPLELVDTDAPIAVAIPGPHQRIVVSEALFHELDVAEQCALLAHERAHLTHRHHWFRVVASLCASGLPLLRPLAGQVRFATERWADEDAAAAVGSRQLVAAAIARTALFGADIGPTSMAMAGSDTIARIEALNEPGSPRRSGRSQVGVWVAVLALTLGASLELAHLSALLIHACTGH